MSDATRIVLLLGVMTACLLAMTLTMILTARDVRMTLQRLSAVLPDAGQALRETRQSLRHVRALLARGDKATRRVESVIDQLCDATTETLGRFTMWKGRAEQFVLGRFGNGTRGEPRQRRRG